MTVSVAAIVLSNSAVSLGPLLQSAISPAATTIGSGRIIGIVDDEAVADNTVWLADGVRLGAGMPGDTVVTNSVGVDCRSDSTLLVVRIFVGVAVTAGVGGSAVGAGAVVQAASSVIMIAYTSSGSFLIYSQIVAIHDTLNVVVDCHKGMMAHQQYYTDVPLI